MEQTHKGLLGLFDLDTAGKAMVDIGDQFADLHDVLDSLHDQLDLFEMLLASLLLGRQDKQ